MTTPIARRTVLVAGGKGGVGKSTVAATLARAAAGRASVGLLDADLSGPSVPHLFGAFDRPVVDDGRIVPPRAFGVRLMSIGLLSPPDRPITWTGPLIRGALWQMLSEVDWGQPDLLVIDSPPGTGETHLALLQLADLSGVVLVTEDDDLALADTRRAEQFYRRAGVPVLGIVINRCGTQARSAPESQSTPGPGVRLEVPYLPGLRNIDRPSAIGPNLAPLLEALSIQ